MNNYDGPPADCLDAISWPAVAIPLSALSAGKLLFSGRALLKGWSLTNNNAGAQTLQLVDGQDSTGAVVAHLPLAAGANSTTPGPDSGILLTQGLFIVVPGGPINGSVWVVPVTGVRGVYS